MNGSIVPTIPNEALTSLIHRLEAATSRLEDMASSSTEPPQTNGSAIPPVVSAAPPPKAPIIPEAPLLEPLPESVEDFDNFLSGPLKRFVNLSDEIGGPVAEQVSNTWRLLSGADGILGIERIPGIYFTTAICSGQHES
jgi:adenylyl cyclase-associated protein